MRRIHGLSLPEVMVSAFVASTFALAIFGLLMKFFGSSVFIEERTTAEQICHTALELHEEDSFSHPLDESILEKTTQNGYEYEVQVTFKKYKDFDTDSVREIEVVVSWQGSRKDKNTLARRSFVAKTN